MPVHFNLSNEEMNLIRSLSRLPLDEHREAMGILPEAERALMALAFGVSRLQFPSVKPLLSSIIGQRQIPTQFPR